MKVRDLKVRDLYEYIHCNIKVFIEPDKEVYFGILEDIPLWLAEKKVLALLPLENNNVMLTIGIYLEEE